VDPEVHPVRRTRIKRLREAADRYRAGFKRNRPRFTPRFRELITSMSRGVRRTLTLLLFIVIACGSFELILAWTSNSQRPAAWKPQELISIAKNRLRAITQQLDSGLTRIEHDVSIVRGMTSSDPQKEVFPFLERDNAQWNRRLPDSLRWNGLLDHRDTAS
jgi:hypothetical protein